MADLDKIFGINMPPKRRKYSPAKKRLFDNHCSDVDRICVYVIGPDDENVSKVGVSCTPYNRLKSLGKWRGKELRICYFAEVSRKEGYKIESIYHMHKRFSGDNIEGEWVLTDRSAITREIRKIMASLGITPSVEVGDTGDDRSGEGISKDFCGVDRYTLPISGKNRRYRG